MIRFKLEMMRYALKHPETRLSLLCSADKILAPQGDAACGETWRALAGSGRVTLIVGCAPNISASERNRLTDAISEIEKLGVKAEIL